MDARRLRQPIQGALADGIIELYANRDPVELGQVMEQALLAAELAGRFEAADRLAED